MSTRNSLKQFIAGMSCFASGNINIRIQRDVTGDMWFGGRVVLQYKRLFTAPAKQHVGQEAAEDPGEITSDFTGQAQRKTKI